MRDPGNVVGRQRNRPPRSVARILGDVRGQPARPGDTHHQLDPVAPADLRQDRTVLADPQEMASRPPCSRRCGRTQRTAGPVPRFLQPPSTTPRLGRNYSRPRFPHPPPPPPPLGRTSPPPRFPPPPKGPPGRLPPARTGFRHPPYRR